MHIVFAEQHAMVRDGLRPFLAELSPEVRVCEVDCAAQLPRAFAEAQALDLAIFDHAMPNLRLEESLNALKALHPASRAVVLSPSVDRAAIARAIALGVAGYVPKSLNARAFVSALRLVLAGERYVPAMVLEGQGIPVGPHGTGDSGSGFDSLTVREREIMSLLRDGLPNKLIARRLNVSEVTVKSHLCHVFRKLGVQNRVQAARKFSAVA